MKKNLELLKKIFSININIKYLLFSKEFDRVNNLGRRQLYTLYVLSQVDHLNMTSLAEKIGVSNQQLTKIVDKLVRKNYAERSYDENNRRVILISLTEEGKKYLSVMSKKISNSIDEHTKSISEERKQEIIKSINTLDDFLKEINK